MGGYLRDATQVAAFQILEDKCKQVGMGLGGEQVEDRGRSCGRFCFRFRFRFHLPSATRPQIRNSPHFESSAECAWAACPSTCPLVVRKATAATCPGETNMTERQGLQQWSAVTIIFFPTRGMQRHCEQGLTVLFCILRIIWPLKIHSLLHRNPLV